MSAGERGERNALGYRNQAKIFEAPLARATSTIAMGVECANGKCQSWIDDELDAMGEAGAHIPRPGGCCEEDAKKQRGGDDVARVARGRSIGGANQAR